MKQPVKGLHLRVSPGGEWANEVRQALLDFERAHQALLINGVHADLRHQKLAGQALQARAQLTIVSESAIQLSLDGGATHIDMEEGDRLEVRRVRKTRPDPLVAPADQVAMEGTIVILRASGEEDETTVAFVHLGHADDDVIHGGASIFTLKRRLSVARRSAETDARLTMDIAPLLSAAADHERWHREARRSLEGYAALGVPLSDTRVQVTLDRFERCAIGFATNVARIEAMLGPGTVARREKQARAAGAKGATEARRKSGHLGWWHDEATEKYAALRLSGEHPKNRDGDVREHLAQLASAASDGRKAPTVRSLSKWRRAQRAPSLAKVP
jgi:hypothetical protein